MCRIYTLTNDQCGHSRPIKYPCDHHLTCAVVPIPISTTTPCRNCIFLLLPAVPSRDHPLLPQARKFWERAMEIGPLNSRQVSIELELGDILFLEEISEMACLAIGEHWGKWECWAALGTAKLILSQYVGVVERGLVHGWERGFEGAWRLPGLMYADDDGGNGRGRSEAGEGTGNENGGGNEDTDATDWVQRLRGREPLEDLDI